MCAMSDSGLKNIALLIDADNTSPKGIDPVLTVMAELGQVNIKRAYGNFAKNNLANWDKITHKYGIRPQQQFDLTAGKNATDMAMTIDAIDLLYQGKVDGFGIMSSDSDFTPLVTRLRMRPSRRPLPVNRGLTMNSSSFSGRDGKPRNATRTASRRLARSAISPATDPASMSATMDSSGYRTCSSPSTSSRSSGARTIISM